jgi:hypothetical protein
MRHTARPPILDAHIRAAWQTQVTAALQTPELSPALVRRRHELFPRFAAYYTQLRALPRRVRRALQRQWRLSLAGIALLLVLGQQPALAATIPVGGACTLVDAITAANADTATGGCPAGSGADTIMLPAGSTQTLTEVNNSTYGPTGLPVIRSVITIAGQGSTIARESSAPEFRLVALDSVGDLTLQETTVSGGRSSSVNGGGVANYGGTLTLTNSTISGNSARGFSGSDGGGVWNSGTVTMTSSTITGNSIHYSSGGGVWNSGTFTLTNSTISGNYGGGSSGGGNGGGVWNDYGGTLTLTNSTIADNSVGIDGYNGGVSNFGTLTVLNSTIAGNGAHCGTGGVSNAGIFTLTNSTISGNSRGGCGNSGGVWNDYGGTLTVTNSTVAGNEAPSGGGVSNGGTLTLTNSTISGNTASSGGGVRNDGTLTLTNSTISGNRAFGDGGGVVNRGTLIITNSTLTGNSTAGSGGDVHSGGGGVFNGGTLTITNSTISGNTAYSDGGGVANGSFFSRAAK